MAPIAAFACAASSSMLAACRIHPREGTPAPPVPAPAAARSPTDLRPSFASYGLEPRGQGDRPTCSIFTVVAALEFALAKATGQGERLSVEYANWAANAATGRDDDGDFFHCALAGYERFGICAERWQPYAMRFVNEAPPPDALVDAGRRLGRDGPRLRVRWIRPIDGGAGLTPEQFADVLETLSRGDPVAAGSAHSRLLVGYREDPAAPGGGVFLALDSSLGGFGEVPAGIVLREVNDAFVVEVVARH